MSTDSKENVTINSNQRLEIAIAEDDLELVINSGDKFGLFGSNNPNAAASVVSHEWFETFDGQVK